MIAEPDNDENEAMLRGRRDDTCDHGLSRKSWRVNKASHELSWKVKVMRT